MHWIRIWILNVAYVAIYAVLFPYILYRRVVHGRSLGNFAERVLGFCPRRDKEDQRVVWLHAVSVGEVNQLEPLLRQLKRRHPKTRFALSTTTATGMRLARQKFPGHTIFYFPIDFSWAIRNVLRRLKPDLMVLTELEIWPNLITLLNKNRVPISIVNGRLGDRSFRAYQKRTRLFRTIFSKIDLVVAQSPQYADRFVQLGCPRSRVMTAGSIKFDGATIQPAPTMVSNLKSLINLTRHDLLWVAGSTQAEEELMSAQVWAQRSNQHPQFLLVIVPRHPERGPAIVRNLRQHKIDAVLQSSLSADQSVSRSRILIADTIGQLTAWWSLCQIAFVGGSFGNRGGQNMIEPAAAGAAVCFGPNVWNFKDVARSILDSGTARQVADRAELARFIDWAVDDPESARHMGKMARQFVMNSQGAVQTTCDHLQILLSPILDSRPDRAGGNTMNPETDVDQPKAA